MPRDIKTYAKCAGPGVARSHRQLTGLTGFLVRLWLRSAAFAVAFFAFFIGALILLNNPAAWLGLVVLLSIALSEFLHWYYNERLLCIRDRDCAIGTVISNPAGPSDDGDRKLNLMLVPYGQRGQVQTLIDHIKANRIMVDDDANFNDPPFHTSAPDLNDNFDGNFDTLRDYLRRLRSADPNDEDAEARMYGNVLIGVMDRLMADPAKNFYNRFHRKDKAHIPEGSALWSALPQDFDETVDWRGVNTPNAAQSNVTQYNPYAQNTQGLNPMFRFDTDHLVFYFHCEIDGYALGRLLENIILALWAFAIAMLIWGPLAALFVMLFFFLLKWWFDKAIDNDGEADSPDVDWDDPDVPESDSAQRKGDVVVTYGNWIMDTEHGQYFEIHPVRAYYIVARNSLGNEPVLVDGNMEQEEFGHENFDPTLIDAARAEQICAIVTGGEEGNPDPVILRSGPTALSYGMQTRYAGNQQVVG